MNRRLLLAALNLVALVAGIACSSGSTQIRPRAPWSPELGEFFDDAADFIQNPGDLQGAWATGYSRELQGRVDEADLICRVTVSTLNEDIDVEGHRRKHLIMRITSVMHGDAPEDERLHLSVDEGSAGFDTIDRSERRLLDNQFVAFVRWFEDEDGAVRGHWHVSPATRAVIEQVRRQIAERHEDGAEEILGEEGGG